MKLIVSNGKKYFAKDIYEKNITRGIISSFYNRKYRGGFYKPYSALVPFAKTDISTITLKTYFNEISNIHIIKKVPFEGPFMVPAVSDYVDRTKMIIEPALNIEKRKKVLERITPPEQSIVEGVNGSPYFAKVPQRLVKIPADYFELLFDFEDSFPRYAKIFEQNKEPVNEYVNVISNSILSFVETRSESIEKPECVDEVEVEAEGSNIEIKFSTGSIFIYSTSIPKDNNEIMHVFNMQPKVYGALDFELFLRELSENIKQVEKTAFEFAHRHGFEGSIISDFIEYYTELSSEFMSLEDVDKIIESVPLLDDADVFIIAKEDSVRIMTEDLNCERATEKIEKVESYITFEFSSLF